MIDRHGWSSDQWDAQTPEAKAMTIASIQYWEGEREKEQKKLDQQMRKK